jgi:hypothetical protein
LVRASIRDSVLHLELSGWSKLLAISRSLDIPLHCINRATAGAPGLPEFRWTDLRTGGASLPGVLAAGRFSMGSPRRRTFLDLRRTSKAVLFVELENYRYDTVIVEVDDITRVLQMIDEAARKTAPSPEDL